MRRDKVRLSRDMSRFVPRQKAIFRLFGQHMGARCCTAERDNGETMQRARSSAVFEGSLSHIVPHCPVLSRLLFHWRGVGEAGQTGTHPFRGVPLVPSHGAGVSGPSLRAPFGGSAERNVSARAKF